MQSLREQLERGESLLAIDDGARLHQSDWTLHLLEHNGAEEARLALSDYGGKNRHCHYERFSHECS